MIPLGFSREPSNQTHHHNDDYLVVENMYKIYHSSHRVSMDPAKDRT